MTSFKARIKKRASESGRLVLACDYDPSARNIGSKTQRQIKMLGRYLCAVKLNFHLLLPLGKKEILKITETAHDCGLQTIADIKLNDIGNTNAVALEHLWGMGLDAVIANPIMGPDGLKQAVSSAHRSSRGLIALYHMSAESAKQAYETRTLPGRKALYELFLDWALQCKADGVIAGATYPDIIRRCKERAGRLDIYSPGVGVQGGSAQAAIDAGSDYLIVGRSIINADDPRGAARDLSAQTRNGPVGL